MALVTGAALPTGDGRTGVLRVGTYGRGVWQVPLLTAANVSAGTPAIALSPVSLSFASQAVSTASATQTMTVTNTGSAPLTVAQLAISEAQLPLGPQAEFTETDNCTSAAVAVGQSCTVNIRFVPAAAGERSATMTIYGNVSGGQATAQLTGTATAAVGGVTLLPNSLSFAETAVNAVSAAQNITVSNTGSGAVALANAAVSGGFTITATTCSGSLAADTSCAYGVAFAPKASGPLGGTFSMTAGSVALSAALSGTGALPATDTLAPTSLSFAAQPLGVPGAAQKVTLTNVGDVALTLIATATTGDFAATNGCGSSLAAHATCAISVAFAPKALGAEAGTLTVSDAYRSQTVALAGTGIAPAGVSLSPLGGVAFPATGVGLASAPSVVTLVNNGGQPLTISSIAVSGDFSIVPGSNSCTATLAVGSSCAMQVAFTPTATGGRTGTISVASSAVNSPQTLPLTGTGVDFALVADGPASATVTAGQSASYALRLTPAAAVPGINATLSCSGLPQYASCNLSPASVAMSGGAAIVQVTVATGGSTALLRRGDAVVLAMLCPVMVFALRRKRVLAALVLSALVVAGGCGSGRAIPDSGAPGTVGVTTPKGSYTVTVMAVGSGLTRSVALTLVVQ
ncbi:MAG: choice-of-anchor D domain-containing protein [Edaphobacter sp.]|uniref:choice-of-anchor D domain-containing protein n=1 Tax=Edaphobacter sp. TaxID=1934404 RepID=UPI00238C9CC1|nr:choice-of-anchor D domain-containing protein [Edaphobacter sp.]MDE1176708.1 choice-of-anchor D domain-containing protein [Edaphobacter sp.]